MFFCANKQRGTVYPYIGYGVQIAALYSFRFIDDLNELIRTVLNVVLLCWPQPMTAGLFYCFNEQTDVFFLSLLGPGTIAPRN